MKYYISFIAALLSVTSSTAQFTYFEAEGIRYYETAGAVPGSDVEFYSEKWGGKLIKNTTTNEDGWLRFAGDKDFKPAFVLNRSIPNKNAVNVTFF